MVNLGNGEEVLGEESADEAPLAERVKFGEAKTGIEGGEKLGNEYSTLDL